MMYLLDTNTCIVYLRTPLGLLAQKLLAVSPIDVGLSTITLVEFYRGAYLSTKASTNLAQVAAFVSRFTVLSLESSAAEIAGRVDAE